MTERDEPWVPENWEKEDEVKMWKRLERGLGEVINRSGGCICTLLLLLPTPLEFIFVPLFSSSKTWITPSERRQMEADDEISVSHPIKQPLSD
jgi:hypothetical protein